MSLNYCSQNNPKFLTNSFFLQILKASQTKKIKLIELKFDVFDYLFWSEKNHPLHKHFEFMSKKLLKNQSRRHFFLQFFCETITKTRRVNEDVIRLCPHLTSTVGGDTKIQFHTSVLLSIKGE